MNFPVTIKKRDKSKEKSEEQVIKETEPEISLREQRIQSILGNTSGNMVAIIFSESEQDKVLPEIVTDCLITDISQKDQPSKKFENFLNNYKWNDNNLKSLFLDALQGIEQSLRLNLNNQIEYQIKCLTRAIVRDHLNKSNLQPEEVRFQKRGAYHRAAWSNMRKERESLKEQEENDDNTDFLIQQSEDGEQIVINMHTVNECPVRISGQALKAIDVLKQFPPGVIEDVWIADLKQIQGTDPLLIIQVGGYSYSICEWEE
jgi:hypothetical protein